MFLFHLHLLTTRVWLGEKNITSNPKSVCLRMIFFCNSLIQQTFSPFNSASHHENITVIRENVTHPLPRCYYYYYYLEFKILYSSP